MRKELFITEPDMRRLERLIENRLPPADARVEALERELDRAVVVDPDKIPAKIVTMNSRVRLLDLDRGSEAVMTVVFPSEANAEQKKISILAPLGTALLGRRVGETVRFDAPAGRRRVKILGIEYQPEAAARERIA